MPPITPDEPRGRRTTTSDRPLAAGEPTAAEEKQAARDREDAKDAAAERAAERAAAGLPLDPLDQADDEAGDEVETLRTAPAVGEVVKMPRHDNDPEGHERRGIVVAVHEPDPNDDDDTGTVVEVYELPAGTHRLFVDDIPA